MPDFVMKRDYEVALIVHPFVAAMPVFVEAMGEPLGVAEKTMLWLERGVSRDLGSGDVELDSAVEAVGGIRREDGRGVGAGPMDGCGHQRGGLGVGANTSGGRLGVGIGRDGLSVVTDAELGGGGCRQGGLGVGAGPGMMMDDGLGPVVNSAWAGSMQLAWADSGADDLVLTVCNGLVPTVFDGLVPIVCDGLVPAGCSAWAEGVHAIGSGRQ